MPADRLELDGLCKRYGEVLALDDLTFDIRAGEIFGFVGSNGAGKTTAMRIALGVLLADRGQVRWQGRPVTFETRRQFGYMPEERGLYPKMKVGEQLTYLARLHGLAAGQARERTRSWTERLGVVDRLDDEVEKLSLGNQQRVQLAAALVHDPAVLVLDEPFSGLDPVAVEVMSQVLRERAAAGVPVLFSSHQLDLVERICDRVGIVRAGRLVACGTVGELQAGGAPEVARPRARCGPELGGPGGRRHRGGHRGRPPGGPPGRGRRRPAAAARGARGRAGARVHPATTAPDRAVPPRRGDRPMSTGATGLGSSQAVRLVAEREVRTRLRSRAYRITTGIMVLLVVGFAVGMRLAGGGSPDRVGYVGAALAPQVRALGSGPGTAVEPVAVPDVPRGRRMVADGRLDALVTRADASGLHVVVKEKLGENLRALLTAAAGRAVLNREIVRLGGDPARVSQAVAHASVQVTALQPAAAFDAQRLAVGSVAGILIYLALLATGASVAQGVVEEKSSRVVELLLSTVRPWQLMAGKVLGIGLVGLLQVALVAVAGVVAGQLTGSLDLSFGATAGVVGWLVVWFVLGFTLYALVFAGFGALVSRQEDVGGVTAPATMFLVVGYVVGISVLPTNPTNPVVAGLSLVPVFSPTLMPMRLAMGSVPWWQVAAALGLAVAAVPLLVWLAGRLYRNGVVRTGARVRLADALRGS